jgi:prophage regulatory protein
MRAHPTISSRRRRQAVDHHLAGLTQYDFTCRKSNQIQRVAVTNEL